MAFKWFIVIAVMANQVFSSSENLTTKDIVHSSNVVSNEVYKILGTGKENILFCPVSSNVLLSMISFAAKGKTLQELKTALHLNSEDEKIKSGYKKLLSELQGGKLNIATRLFPKTGVTIKPEFSTVAQTYFGSKVQAVDFSNPTEAAKIINTFVEEKTNNKINDLVDPNTLHPDTSLVTVNAAHFKDSWRHPFDNTIDSDFHVSKNEKVKTKMMDVTNWFPFKSSSSLKAKVVRLPFETDKYSMIIVLPNEIDGLTDVEAKFASKFDEVLSNLTVENVEVKMPVFKIEAKLDMKTVLEELGVKMLFSMDADLSGLVQGDQLHVSDIIQKTYIDVNKDGVEAAAATEIGMVGYAGFSNSEPPKKFTADHPFLFAILWDNFIIFQGRFSKVNQK